MIKTYMKPRHIKPRPVKVREYKVRPIVVGRKAIDKDRKAGSQVDLDKLEERLKAKRMEDQAEEMRKFAEKVANSQAKKHRGKVWIDDILKHRNPNHKVASDAFVRFVRKMGVDIPAGEYSAYQIMRIKERVEKSRR